MEKTPDESKENERKINFLGKRQTMKENQKLIKEMKIRTEQVKMLLKEKKIKS